MARKYIVLCLKTGVAFYFVQLLFVAFWHASPVAEQHSGGKVYRIQRGYGNSWDLIPVIGLMPALGETVTLTITDERTGVVESTTHDDDEHNVYFDYRDIFKDTSVESDSSGDLIDTCP